MHVAFGRVRRKSRIVADYADYADYRVRDGGRWLVIGCWVSLRSTWGKHPSKNTRSYSKSGDREHSSLLQQEDREHSSLLQQEVPGVLPN